MCLRHIQSQLQLFEAVHVRMLRDVCQEQTALLRPNDKKGGSKKTREEVALAVTQCKARFHRSTQSLIRKYDLWMCESLEASHEIFLTPISLTLGVQGRRSVSFEEKFHPTCTMEDVHARLKAAWERVEGLSPEVLPDFVKGSTKYGFQFIKERRGKDESSGSGKGRGGGFLGKSLSIFRKARSKGSDVQGDVTWTQMEVVVIEDDSKLLMEYNLGVHPVLTLQIPTLLHQEPVIVPNVSPSSFAAPIQMQLGLELQAIPADFDPTLNGNDAGRPKNPFEEEKELEFLVVPKEGSNIPSPDFAPQPNVAMPIVSPVDLKDAVIATFSANRAQPAAGPQNGAPFGIVQSSYNGAIVFPPN